MYRWTRRRLLVTSLGGLPLAAACGGSDAPGGAGLAGELGGPSAPPPPPPSATTVSSDALALPTQEPGAPQPVAAPPAPTPAPEPRRRTVVLDPGHGGDEIGAANAFPGLPILREKDTNLAFALRLRELLEGDGLRVVMTRESDSRGFGFLPPPPSSTPPGAATPAAGGQTPGRVDLQARIDWANAAGGDLFLSLHSNDTAGDIGENGVEVWYCADREDGLANAVWAQTVLDHVLEGLRGYGYRATDRGIKEDRYFRVRNGRNFHIFLLGPPNPEAFHPRSTMMPAALVENLFMRHERDGRVLHDPAAREAISQGMRRAVHRFFELRGS